MNGARHAANIFDFQITDIAELARLKDALLIREVKFEALNN